MYKKNIFHLIAIILNSTMILGYIFLLSWIMAYLNLDNGLALFAFSISLIVLSVIGSIFVGLKQLQVEKGNFNHRFGYHTIFASILIYPIYYNIEIYQDSGFSKKKLQKVIDYWNVKNIDKIIENLTNEKSLGIDLLKDIKELQVQRDKNILSLKEANKYIYHLLKEHLGLAKIPALYTQKEIIEIKEIV